MIFSRIKGSKFDFFSSILFFLILVQLGVSVWAVDKGFDFSDEAYSYLGYQNQQEIDHVVTYYTFLITNLFDWLSLDIINVRILKLVIQIVSSFMFSYGLLKMIRSFPKFSNINPFHIHLASLSGSLLYNATGSQMLTYDILSVVLLQFGAGLLFIIMSCEETTKVVSYIRYTLVGAVVFALFMVKFSNAILFVGIFYAFFLSAKKIKELPLSLLLIAIGFVIFGFLIFRTELLLWLYSYITTLTTATDNTLSAILDKYVWDANDLVVNLFIGNILIFIIAVATTVITCLAQKKYIKIISLIASGGLLMWFTIIGDFYLGGIAHRYTYSLLYIFIITLLLLALSIIWVIQKFKQFNLKQNYPLILTFLLILSAPFVGSVGTNNYLRMNIILYMSFWFAFIYLLSYRMDKRLALILLLLISINACYQGIYGLVYSPYRLYTSLIDQNTSLPESINAKGIKLDASKVKEVEQVYELIHSQTNFNPGMPIFSYRSEYGFIYLLNGTLPGWCWYREDTFQKSYCDCLTNSKIKDFEKMIFIIPKDHQMDSAFVSTLNSVNVAYPEHYQSLGDVESFFEGAARNLVILAPENILKQPK